MPTPTKGNRLGGSPAHERLILSNLASQLFEHRRISVLPEQKSSHDPMGVKTKTSDDH